MLRLLDLGDHDEGLSILVGTSWGPRLGLVLLVSGVDLVHELQLVWVEVDIRYELRLGQVLHRDPLVRQVLVLILGVRLLIQHSAWTACSCRNALP